METRENTGQRRNAVSKLTDYEPEVRIRRKGLSLRNHIHTGSGVHEAYVDKAA
jgi:hypothetical protein